MNIRSDRPRPQWFWAALAVLMLLAPCTPARAADALEPYRERFQTGLDRYRQGDIHGAVQYWEAIRKQLGDVKAYRLLFNLGKAYEKLGDASRAYERYSAFVRQVELHASADDLEPAVRDNGDKALKRIDELRKTRGRIRIKASLRPGVVEIDDGDPSVGPTLELVAPGKHKVVVDPGTPLQRVLNVDVTAGQEVTVDPTRPKPPDPAPMSRQQPDKKQPTRPTPAQRKSRVITETKRPFPGYVLAVSAAVSAVSVALPLWTYQQAGDIANEYNDPATSNQRRRVLYDQYKSARRSYDLSWILPGTLAATTAGLGAWYLLGSQTRERPVVVSVGGSREAVTVQAAGHF